MKRRRNKKSTESADKVDVQQVLSDDQGSTDEDIIRAVSRLPDPGPAMIADAVMRRIRQSQVDTIRLRPRQIAWGFAGGIAGLLLGLWLASATPDRIQFVAQNGYDTEFVELADDIDLFAWELSGDSEVTP